MRHSVISGFLDQAVVWRRRVNLRETIPTPRSPLLLPHLKTGAANGTREEPYDFLARGQIKHKYKCGYSEQISIDWTRRPNRRFFSRRRQVRVGSFTTSRWNSGAIGIVPAAISPTCHSDLKSQLSAPRLRGWPQLRFMPFKWRCGQSMLHSSGS